MKVKLDLPNSLLKLHKPEQAHLSALVSGLQLRLAPHGPRASWPGWDVADFGVDFGDGAVLTVRVLDAAAFGVTLPKR